MQNAYDCKTQELVATPIQAIGAELDRDTNRLTLTPGQARLPQLACSCPLR